MKNKNKYIIILLTALLLITQLLSCFVVLDNPNNSFNKPIILLAIIFYSLNALTVFFVGYLTKSRVITPSIFAVELAICIISPLFKINKGFLFTAYLFTVAPHTPLYMVMGIKTIFGFFAFILAFYLINLAIFFLGRRLRSIKDKKLFA